ncbi:type IV pilus modification protein PilV [Microbulbifer magnicolonia]|uniref:type IV pilus modification protein PilV n=1 Tax=Microbulbifer magnicolonia TaxID=3109744 RepID=UPI002B412971|nr:type IV pilus modification protein PilV [Microbulbifer sp. GG15]
MRNQRGATLIEVLIAVLVLAVGLLGLAATQLMSMKNGNGAHQRYMAALAAHDIIERMRANPGGFEQGSYDGEVGEGAAEETGGNDGPVEIEETVVDGEVVETEVPETGGEETGGEEGTPDCSSSCSVTELAALDLYEWEQLLSSNLPSAIGAISRNGDQVTVTITWQEQHTGENYGTSSGGLDDASFEMIVEL